MAHVDLDELDPASEEEPVPEAAAPIEGDVEMEQVNGNELRVELTTQDQKTT